MDFDLNVWVDAFLAELKKLFGPRLIFVGLQGSYNRGEATEHSDIDMVVILDQVTPADLRKYGEMLDTLPHREKACGFIAGKQELLAWERSDLFQFYHDTTPILGSLDFLAPLIESADVRRAIRISACNIYHLCGHNLVHAKDPGMLRSLYKSATFTIQALYYDQTGDYLQQKSALLPLLQPEDQAILKAAMALRADPQEAVEAFDHYADPLFNWAERVIDHYQP